MERKIWLKPADEENGQAAINNGYFKNGQSDISASVVECLYLDTPEMIFLKNNIALIICSGTDGVYQMAVFGNASKNLEPEYKVLFGSDAFDFSLFPEAVSEKLKSIKAGEPLTVRLALSFELKTRGLKPKNGGNLLLVKTAGSFENEEIKGELSALAIKGADGDPAYFAENVDIIINETKLIRCPSPWIEAIRIKTSGFQPSALSEKKQKKYYSSGLMRIFTVRVFEFIKAYDNAETKKFDKDTIHVLRVETRKLLSLLEAFEETFEDQTAKYISFLKTILVDTDIVRSVDILEEELDIITASQPRIDFTALQQKLNEEREEAAEKLISNCKSGSYSERIIELWTCIQRRKVYWESVHDEKKEYDKAIIKINGWVKKIGGLKKSGFDDPEMAHDFRVNIKKVRYTVENMDGIPKKLERITSGLKKLQDATGAVCDMNMDISILQRIASSEPAASYQCGFCVGVLSAGLQESRKEAYSLWKNNRGKYTAIEED